MLAPPAPDTLGYLSYLAVVFLPGLGLGELLGIWADRKSTLMEMVAYSFGLGLAVDTLVLAFKTSGLRVGGAALTGIDLSTIYLLIGGGFVLLLVSALWRRRLVVFSRPKRVDIALLSIMAVVALMESLYFLKYPIFPQYESVDFGVHVQFVQGLISGSQTTFPAGILYFGVHYQLAAALLLVGGEPLVTVQRTMAILVVLSPLLFYLAAERISSRRLAGVVVAALYALSATVWFVGVFNSGLFPNFFGILAALFLLVATVGMSRSVGSVRAWAVMVLAVVLVYFSHYTTVTILPALLSLPILFFLKERRWSTGYLAAAGVTILPGLAGVAVFPATLERALELAAGGGGTLSGTTALSVAFSGFPALSFVALEVYNDAGFLILLAFAAIGVYAAARRRVLLLAVPLVWLASLLVAAPLNVSAWRFSYEALVPLTIMSGYGLFVVLPKPRAGSKRRHGRGYGLTLLALALLLSPIIATSWAQTAMTDAVTDPGTSAAAQRAVYTAIYWLQSNTPIGSTYLSATDWRFTFTNLILSSQTFVSPPGQCLTDPHTAQRDAIQNNASYIIVTNAVTCSLQPDPQLFLWNTLKPSSNLTLVYSNSDVKVFKVI